MIDVLKNISMKHVNNGENVQRINETMLQE